MGYDTALFVDTVDDDLICSICHDVLEKPVTACGLGHVFCQTCLLSGFSIFCPNCRSDMWPRKPPNLPVKSLIMKLKVRCPRSSQADQENDSSRTNIVSSDHDPKESEQCDWEGPLSEYLDTHCNGKCSFELVKCPDRRCMERMRVREVQSHQESDCPFRSVSCLLCQETMEHRELSEHTRHFCPEAQVPCEFCGENIKRKHFLGNDGDSAPSSEYTGHYKECTKAPVQCAFHKYGCSEIMPRKDLADHYAKNEHEHANLVAAALDDMKDDMKDMKADMKDMKARLVSLTDDMEKLALHTADMSAQLVSLKDDVNSRLSSSSDDLNWHKCNVSLAISRDILQKAKEARMALVHESSPLVKVGPFQVFFRMHFGHEGITMSIVAVEPPAMLSIDSLSIKGETVWLEQPTLQTMYMCHDDEKGEMTCPTVEMKLLCVERSATVYDLLLEEQSLKVSFRLKGPEEILVSIGH